MLTLGLREQKRTRGQDLLGSLTHGLHLLRLQDSSPSFRTEKYEAQDVTKKLKSQSGGIRERQLCSSLWPHHSELQASNSDFTGLLLEEINLGHLVEVRQNLRRPLPSGSCSVIPPKSFASGEFSLFLKIFPGVTGSFQGGCMQAET